MRKTRTAHASLIAGVLVTLGAGLALGQQSPQPAQTRLDLSTIGALPDSVDMVLALNGLAALRPSASGKALEAFLREASDWDRSDAAWDELSLALGLSQSQAIDALLGSNVVLAGSGMDPLRPNSPAQFAVICQTTPQTEGLLRAKLKPAPRTLIKGLPILALEDGAYQLAANNRPNGAIVLVAPEASDRIFEELLPSLTGAAAPHPLSMTGSWSRIRDLGTGDLFFMLRSPSRAPANAPGPTPPDELFALTASATGDGWTAKFSATESMLVGRFAASAGDGVWPSAAIDALEDGSVLLVAGSPHQQAAPAAIKSDRPLLLELLDMMDLPDELKQAMDGYAIIAVHADGAPHAPDEAVSIVAVLPFPDLQPAAAASERWAMSVGAGDDLWQNAPVSQWKGVRSVPIKAATPGLIRDDLRGKGTMAWCFSSPRNLPDTNTPPRSQGWVVVSIRFGAGDPSLASVVAKRVGDQLEDEEGRDQASLFRLVVHPHDLGSLLQQSKAPTSLAAVDGPRTGGALAQGPREAIRAKDPLGAMRWLDEVESRITRTSPGQVEGSVSLRLNLHLLDEPKTK